jgi:hypothetical protein
LSGYADYHIPVGLFAKAITPHAAAALLSIVIECLDIRGNSRLVELPAEELELTRVHNHCEQRCERRFEQTPRPRTRSQI